LLAAGLIAAGLDGIARELDPGPRLNINMYTHGHTVPDAKRLPQNLLDALRALEASPVLTERLGTLVPAFLKLKREEWGSFTRHLTQWERDHTLDC